MNDVIDLVFNDERSQKILRDAMERLDLSAEGTIRYFCRMGQLVDERIQQGYKLGWIKNGEVVDPDDVVPKMAPMAFPPVRSCNRHSDCEEAEQDVLKRNPGRTLNEISPSFHCHDDECEDCFGS